MGNNLGPVSTREQQAREELAKLIAQWERCPDQDEVVKQMIAGYKEMLKKLL